MPPNASRPTPRRASAELLVRDPLQEASRPDTPWPDPERFRARVEQLRDSGLLVSAKAAHGGTLAGLPHLSPVEFGRTYPMVSGPTAQIGGRPRRADHQARP